MEGPLADLAAAYGDARSRPIAGAEDVPDRCRYCGRWWRPWSGSKLDGHASCVITEAFKQQLLETLDRNPGLQLRAVAEALAVTIASVRCWVSDARAARGRS